MEPQEPAASELAADTCGDPVVESPKSERSAESPEGDRSAAPLEDLMGTWVDSRGMALVFKMDDTGCCQVEKRRAEDGSLIASGMLDSRASSDGWRVWDRRDYGTGRYSPDMREAFRVNKSNHDSLEHLIMETWGGWDGASPLHRCTDEIILHKCSPQETPPATAVDAAPSRTSLLLRDAALVGSGDGYVEHLQSGLQTWSRHVREWLSGGTSSFEYGVNVVAFSPDGSHAFLGTTAGTFPPREPTHQTDGYVICFRTADAKKMWSWHARSLKNPSTLHVKDLSVAPNGQSVAVSCYRKPFLGFDGMETPCGNDKIVYLGTFGDGSSVEAEWTHPTKKSVVALAHSPHSVYLAACLQRGGFSLYRDEIACFATNSGHLIWSSKMVGQKLCECKIVFSPGGRFILCAALGHSCEENDDFPGSMLAEVDEDDFCTVTCIAIESGQVVWRSKPIPDFTVSSMQLTASLDARSILVLCRCLDGPCQGPLQGDDDAYHGAVVCLDAQTGTLTRKGRFRLPKTLGSLGLMQCRDSRVAIAVDAWEGEETAAKIFAFKLCEAPAGLGREAEAKPWMTSEAHWPAVVSPELLWMTVMPNVRHKLTSFAFKPEFPVKQWPLEEEAQLEQEDDQGLLLGENLEMAAETDRPHDPQASSSAPKRRSHHQRQRKKKYLASVQLPTPSSFD